MNKPKHKKLKQTFLTMSSWEDIEVLINIYQKNNDIIPSVLIEKKHVSYLLFSKKKKYVQYIVPKKKKGQFRTLEAPTNKLKIIQQTIKECIELCWQPKPAAHGFVANKSIVTNAQSHLNRKYIFNIDLKKFFPSIHFGRIKGIFQSKPFNFPPDVAKTLANLCCNDSGILPQGASTSPVISNLICRGLDGKLSKLAKKFRVRYTRYVDDITFSSNRNIFDGRFFNVLESIIESEDFKINTEKIRLLDKAKRQEVTGLIINKKLNVKREYIKNLKWLIKIKAKDVKNPKENIAQIWLLNNYTNSYRYNGKIPAIDDIIKGKLDFLKMVVGKEAETHKKLLSKYKAACGEVILSENEKERLGQKFETLVQNFENAERASGKINVMVQLLAFRIEHEDKKEFEESIAELDKTFRDFCNNSTNPFLTVNILKRNYSSPISKIFESIEIDGVLKKSMTPQENRPYNSSNNPKHLAQLLGLFRDTSHPFGRIVHGDESQTFGECYILAKKEFEKIESDRTEEMYQAIPSEIYGALNTFLKIAGSTLKKNKYWDKPLSNFLRGEPSLIQGFKAFFRFDNHENIKMSDLILSEFERINDGTIWSLQINCEEVDHLFDNVLTSIHNISFAIRKILESCIKYGEIGAIKIQAKKENNAVILQIINLGYFTNSSSAEFRLGGDIKSIVSLLKGYCDWNISTKFQNSTPGKISLSPSKDSAELIDDDTSIEGFTYELIFYQPIKILLVDNGENKNRIRQAMKIRDSNQEFKQLLDCFEEINNFDILSNYNAVFIHVNNSEYTSIRDILNKKKTPHIVFGGEKQSRSDIYNHGLSLNDKDFYFNLQNFLDYVKINLKISLELFISRIEESKIANFKDTKNVTIEENQVSNTQLEHVQNVNDLADYIQDAYLDIKQLPIEINHKIEELIEDKIELPPFNNLLQLTNFIKDNKKK